jgi:hypothetical protein
MYIDSWFWLICPIAFFGVMALCMIFSRRRGHWSCCSPFDNRSSYDDRLRKLEDEMRRRAGRE